MKTAVSGASGLIGTSLLSRLTSAGHQVLRLVRSRDTAADSVNWDPIQGTIASDRLKDIDAVVHLAGDNIAKGRWTATKKARIRDSRVKGTQFLCRTLAALEPRPSTLIAASAIGFYGSRNDLICDEQTTTGDDFLAEVCQTWEAVTESASAAGIRVVNLRIGIVLSPDGGALTPMLFPFKLGVGGRVGSGKQYWSWISLDDLVEIILHCLENESLSGPVNAVAPNPVTNFEFTKALGRTLRRPTILPIPAFVARSTLGEMADALILSSTRVEPKRLETSGFVFQHPTIDEALQHLLVR